MVTCSCASLGKHGLGIICVLLVVFLWVSSSELIQSIFRNNNYFHPFFLTYFSTSLFMIYGPFFIRLCSNSIRDRHNGTSNGPSPYSVLSTEESPSNRSTKSLSDDSDNKENYRSTSLDSDSHQDDSKPALSMQPPRPLSSDIKGNNINNNNNSNNKDLNLIMDTEETEILDSFPICSFDWFCIPHVGRNQLSLYETIKLSAFFCPIWFLMNYTFNSSLDKTSVASNTILSTMSGPFSLILSAIFLKTKFSLWNVAGVAIVLTGAVFIGYLDKTSSDGNDTLWGDALALISAFIYGTYVTLLKYRIGDDSKVNMFLFFALIGLINVLTLWPILFAWDWLGIEGFILPEKDVLILLTINGIVSVLSDYFWAQSVLLTSPVVATVGLSLMMPFAMIADEVFRNVKHSIYYWIGSFFVALGFILVNMDFKKTLDIEKQKLTELEDNIREIHDVFNNYQQSSDMKDLQAPKKDNFNYDSATSVTSIGQSDHSGKEEDYTTDAGL